MGRDDKTLGESCVKCGHFRGLHTPFGGCTALERYKIASCPCKESQMSILEDALSYAMQMIKDLTKSEED